MASTATLPSRRTATLPCSIDPEKWYDQDQEQAAKADCGACPARETCLLLALRTDEPWGVWGGFTTVERARIAAGSIPRPCRHCHLPCVPRRAQHASCDRCADEHASRNRVEDVDAVSQLAAAGQTDPDIAARLGWKVWQVKEFRKKHSIVSRWPNGGGCRKQPADLAPCGTNAAYRRHKRRGEPVDEACLVAERRKAAAYYRSSKAKTRRQ
ncbi:WhiB family transcriptional regulator [Micromonospora sp. FIMYZ51]|uniref:WhiB family transcriptional regulator n=1 Tax=Micromonospora sp. FIMYZ51 TaxID=3051832 RepID=UPI00311D87B4